MSQITEIHRVCWSIFQTNARNTWNFHSKCDPIHSYPFCIWPDVVIAVPVWFHLWFFHTIDLYGPPVAVIVTHILRLKHVMHLRQGLRNCVYIYIEIKHYILYINYIHCNIHNIWFQYHRANMCIYIYINQVICILDVCHSSPSHSMCSGVLFKKKRIQQVHLLHVGPRFCDVNIGFAFHGSWNKRSQLQIQVCHREIHVSGAFALRELLKLEKEIKWTFPNWMIHAGYNNSHLLKPCCFFNKVKSWYYSLQKNFTLYLY